VLGLVVPQSVNEEPSSEHWNFVIACESVYVKDAEAWFVGLAGFAESEGAGGGSLFAIPAPTVASAPSKTARSTAFVAAFPGRGRIGYGFGER
jgi:hypothetical protein